MEALASTNTPETLRAAIADRIEHLQKSHSKNPAAARLLSEVGTLAAHLYAAQHAQEELVAQQLERIALLEAQRDTLVQELVEIKRAVRLASWLDGRRDLARGLAEQIGADVDALWTFLEAWAAGDALQSAIEIEHLEALLAAACETVEGDPNATR